MTKVRTTHPRYVPPVVAALLWITVFMLFGAILLLLARMWGHLG